MSWWDPKTLSSFANQATAALKTAQKRIDKVLDIKEDGDESPQAATSGLSGDTDFFNAWMSPSKAEEPSPLLSQPASQTLPSPLLSQSAAQKPPQPKSSVSDATSKPSLDHVAAKKSSLTLKINKPKKKDGDKEQDSEEKRAYEERLKREKAAEAELFNMLETTSPAATTKKERPYQLSTAAPSVQQEVKTVKSLRKTSKEDVSKLKSDSEGGSGADVMHQVDSNEPSHESLFNMSESTACLVEDEAAWGDMNMSIGGDEILQPTGQSDSQNITQKVNSQKTESTTVVENVPSHSSISAEKSSLSNNEEVQFSLPEDSKTVVEQTEMHEQQSDLLSSLPTEEDMKDDHVVTNESESRSADLTQNNTAEVSESWTTAEAERTTVDVTKSETTDVAVNNNASTSVADSRTVTVTELKSDVNEESGTNKDKEEPSEDVTVKAAENVAEELSDIPVIQENVTESDQTEPEMSESESQVATLADSLSAKDSVSMVGSSSSTDNTIIDTSFMSQSNDTEVSSHSTDTNTSSDEAPHARERGESESTVVDASSFNVSLPEEKQQEIAEEFEQVELENVSSTSGSFVKASFDDAVSDGARDTESHADSASSSDMVRVESSQNSGHTSADEFETTTSSDIEIISHISTPNGDNRFPYELSPFRQGIPGTSRFSPPGHQRNDSGTYSKYMEEAKQMVLRRKSTEATQNPPAEPQKPVEAAEQNLYSNPHERERLMKKIVELTEVLEAREKRLVDLSRENMSYQETNTILHNQIKQLEEVREAEQTDLNTLTDEFTKRIAESEKKLQLTIKEKDTYKKRLQETELALMQRSDSSHTAEKMLREKDQQISELLEEGEKLSKQQLQSSNVVKKLRAKEKENENALKTLRDAHEKKIQELDRLQKILDNKCDVEKKNNETINQLQVAVKKQEQEIDRLRNELEDTQEKARSAQAALDSSYKEIAELHKSNAARASEVQSAALSAELQAKQELQLTLERSQQEARRQQEGLVNQIEDLRMSMSRMEREQGRREDQLRQEISDLQQRLQEAEDRNQELTESVSAATRPLLRQIENLQSTYSAQSSSYEIAEKSLMDRLADAQHQLASSQERERSAQEELMSVSARVSGLESQVSSLRQEKSRLQAQIEVQDAKTAMLEESKNKEASQKESMKKQMDEEITDLKKEKLLLENQLEMERVRVETERKKFQTLQEQLTDKEYQLSQVKSSRSSTPRADVSTPIPREPPSPMSQSFMGPMSSSMYSQGDEYERSAFSPIANGSTRMSLYDSLRYVGGASSLLENLQAQLKQKDGELHQLQSDIHELERTRESMARELVNVSNQKDELENTVAKQNELGKKHAELVQRYNALLQMYGEKEEQVQELKLDLSDMKDMYRSQIDELLQKS